MNWGWINLFNTDGFPARWYCGHAWYEEPAWGWIHIFSDIAVWGAYTAIPIVLLYFLRRRKDIPFPAVFWLFVAFIFACGTTHVIEAIIFWWPVYRLSAVVKLATAIVSWGTVIALLRVTPLAMSLRGPRQLQDEVHKRTQELQSLNAQLEKEIVARQLAEQAAHAASQTKSEFLANMSHELRTPLTAVMGLTEVLNTEETDQEKRQLLAMIRQGGDHLLNLINDILDLSKIEAGRIENNKIACQPGEIAAEVVDSLRVSAAAKSIELSWTMDDNMPTTIAAAPIRLRQILFNLAGNAVKFTDHGSVTVHLQIDPLDSQLLRFSVTDTGEGIPPEGLKLLFEPFSQLDGTAARRRDGAGLGLSISKRLAETMGGTIEVESQPGQGSTFALRLPLEIMAAEEPTAPGNEAAAALPTTIPGHVLIVEDAPSIQFLVRRILEGAGATVTSAGDGAEAIEMLLADQERPFDLVLMDMHMPIMSGYDAAQALRQKGCEIPIIALTASAMTGDRIKCLAAGCDDYLPKPIDQRKLLQMVAKYVLQNRRQE
ncbi:ATP-binding protein [Blastopirellula marina]|uniref:Sensory/regulatory protein RpfC n=1 Tax=Blastopirellula marina DSM 3645 TaxID=314230 RepID=A3ZZM7_9BACT|nr:ATP-binding protein [Blastopirellula marina]EAQ78009.1 sensory transduction histidine kinase [Blastopirellula marina DSM 3645]